MALMAGNSRSEISSEKQNRFWAEERARREGFADSAIGGRRTGKRAAKVFLHRPKAGFHLMLDEIERILDD